MASLIIMSMRRQSVTLDALRTQDSFVLLRLAGRYRHLLTVFFSAEKKRICIPLVEVPIDRMNGSNLTGKSTVNFLPVS